VAIVITFIVTYFILRSSDYINRALGVTGILVMTRIQGMILGAIAVNFVTLWRWNIAMALRKGEAQGYFYHRTYKPTIKRYRFISLRYGNMWKIRNAPKILSNIFLDYPAKSVFSEARGVSLATGCHAKSRHHNNSLRKSIKR
jgi:hypothetical protein